ncbi:MAG: hypothetical protein ACI84C_001519 [Flavobacteriales bacterium]|jgi:uncharacterized protein YdeI (YjbR/CyaY-like superfamily)
MDDEYHVLEQDESSEMSQLGQVNSIGDITSRAILRELVSSVVQLKNPGIELPTKAPKQKNDTPIPDDFQFALVKNKDAKKVFLNFASGQ